MLVPSPLHPRLSVILLFFGSLHETCNCAGEAFSQALPETCPHCGADFGSFYDKNYPCHGGPNASEASGEYYFLSFFPTDLYFDAAVCTECGKHVRPPVLYRYVEEKDGEPASSR